MEKFNVDLAHSSIQFQVVHMMISKVKGTFNNFSADLTFNPDDLTTGSFEVTIDVASIDTNNENRDNHLKSPDFFDAESYPTIHFTATSIVNTKGSKYDMTGNLTIQNMTKPITFEVEYIGKGKTPDSIEVYAFEAETSINRKDFGLNWNATLETGGVLVGEKVKITIDLELNKA